MPKNTERFYVTHTAGRWWVRDADTGVVEAVRATKGEARRTADRLNAGLA